MRGGSWNCAAEYCGGERDALDAGCVRRMARINAEVRDNTLQARRDGLVSGWELTKREQRKHRRQRKRVSWGEKR